MPFWTYCQNNSGGYFDGPQYVIVEADSCAEANDLAQEKAGVYFDGCDSGNDCECCGDRWSRAWEDGSDEPLIHGMNVEEWVSSDFGSMFDATIDSVLVIRKNQIST